MKIKLTKETILRIKHPKNAHIKKGLEEALGKATSTIWAAVELNRTNGQLTTEAALQYLEDNLNMTRSQLIEIENEE